MTGSLAKRLESVAGVDSLLLLDIKSLYSCSEVFVCVGGVESQPFTVDVGLRPECVVLLLLFPVYTN